MQVGGKVLTLRLLQYLMPSLHTAIEIYWNECDVIIRIVPDRPLGIQLTFHVQVLASSQRI